MLNLIVQEFCFEKNGLLVYADFQSTPNQVIAYSPEIKIDSPLDCKGAMIFNAECITFRRGKPEGLSVYIATDPIEEIVKQQNKFNVRAPRGHCPSYELGGSWYFSLDGSVHVWEMTTGFHNNWLLGQAAAGEEVISHSGIRYLMEEKNKLLNFSAQTAQGTNSLTILQSPKDTKSLLDSFDFSVGII